MRPPTVDFSATIDVTRDATLIMVVCSGASLLGCLTVVVSILVFSRHYLRKASMEILLYMFVSNLLTSAGSLVGEPEDCSSLCWFEGIVTNVFTLSSVLWNAALMHLLYSVLDGEKKVGTSYSLWSRYDLLDSEAGGALVDACCMLGHPGDRHGDPSVKCDLRSSGRSRVVLGGAYREHSQVGDEALVLAVVLHLAMVHLRSHRRLLWPDCVEARVSEGRDRRAIPRDLLQDAGLPDHHIRIMVPFDMPRLRFIREPGAGIRSLVQQSYERPILPHGRLLESTVLVHKPGPRERVAEAC